MSSWREALEKPAASVSAPPGAVEPLDVEVRRQVAAREVERAGERQFRRLPEDRLLEDDAVELERRDLDRDRQLGQREGLGLGRRQRPGLRRRLGLAEPGDALRPEPVDRDPSAQQREAAPVELDVVDLEPDALGVGDRHLGDRARATTARPRPRSGGSGGRVPKAGSRRGWSGSRCRCGRRPRPGRGRRGRRARARRGERRSVSKRLPDPDVEGDARVARVGLERRREVEAQNADAGVVARAEPGAGLEGRSRRRSPRSRSRSRRRRSRPRRSAR